MVIVRNETFSAKTQLWCVVIVVILAIVVEVAALNGPNVCMVKQKYNITKRVKYRAPMSVRTYEWCMSIPPRCSKWSTEMRDLTRLETEERTAEVAVCCPGYKMKEVSCVPICPNGRTGHGCSQECPHNKWGPNCVNDCQQCSDHGTCSPITGECFCQEGWQGERCESRMSSTTSTTTTTAKVEGLLTKKPATKPTPPNISTIPSTARTYLAENTSSSTSEISILEKAVTTLRAPIYTTTTSTKAFDETSPRTSVDFIPSSKNSVASNNKILSNKTTLLEYTTLDTSHVVKHTTKTLSVFKASSTKVPVMTPQIIITNTSPITIPIPSNTREVSIQPLNTENTLLAETKTKGELTENKKLDEVTITSRATYFPTTVYPNSTEFTTTEALQPTTETTKKVISTEPSRETKKYVKEVHVEIKTTPIKILKISESVSTGIPHKVVAANNFNETRLLTSSNAKTSAEETISENTKPKAEMTRRPDATIRYFPTTVKFKPKEIWIRPAQKGESFAETKKSNYDLHLRHRVATNKEPAPNTTPKTIIVSIIPTSVSYATFKKIALTTASILSPTTNMTHKHYNKSLEQGITKPMSVITTVAPHTSTKMSLSPTNTVENATKPSTLKNVNSTASNTTFQNIAKTILTLSNTGINWRNKTVSLHGTNSMTTVNQNLNSFNSITPTVSLTNFIKTTFKPSIAMEKTTSNDLNRQVEKVKNSFTKIVTAKPRNVTIINVSRKNGTVITKTVVKDLEKTNATKVQDIINTKTNRITTESPDDEEIFHILTEPEHITAVMEGKEKERTSVDLISVISIAGGIMMAVITVAVIIVMVERCRRPRYEDVRKMNDIHMQVMIDNNDVPPPYVRSIFHTPLPDPPSSEKCHYQPISTLDRNLKQFMRPVVVQTISPIMLENFRGILECHYDHLPRRSHDFEARQNRCSVLPSTDGGGELSHLRPCSFAESTIDALKCEAKLDILDSTTSEPLYAEIPCWRPPSEHAIEIMNLNGEAVTEL